MNKHQYNPNCSFQIITMDTGENVSVSTEDFERLIQHHWHMHSGYAATGHDNYRMHHMILGLTDFTLVEVHHKDNNKLNNCRGNLQVLDFSTHLVTRSKQSNNQSGYKGVSWKNPQGTRKGKWIAQISKDRRKIMIGRFDDPIEAARAYDVKAKELFGDAAYLNFPNE